MRGIKRKDVYILVLSKDFYVEAEKRDSGESVGSYDFWLCRTDFGEKTYVYGIPLDYASSVYDALEKNQGTLSDRDYMEIFLEHLTDEGEFVSNDFIIE